jgi:uncharacterized protein YkwD
MKRASVLFAFLLAVTGLVAGSTAPAGASAATTVRLQALNNDILTSLNATRASRKLRPLVLSDDLQRAASAHSRSMLDNGFFEHESKDGSPFSVRVKRYYRPGGYDSWSAGENLLYSTSEIDASTAIKAWLNSPMHRANMLSPTWREVGIGAFYASAAGGTFGGEATWVITMDFGTRSVSSRKT